MNTRAIMLSAPLLLVSALTYAAPATQADFPHPGHAPWRHGGHPPHPVPLYAVTETTSTPAETLKKLADQVPQADAGKYVVRMEVLPLPPTPEKPAPSH